MLLISPYQLYKPSIYSGIRTTTIVLCNTQVVSGEAKAFIRTADLIAVNVTSKFDFLFSSTAVIGGFAAVCQLC